MRFIRQTKYTFVLWAGAMGGALWMLTFQNSNFNPVVIASFLGLIGFAGSFGVQLFRKRPESDEVLDVPDNAQGRAHLGNVAVLGFVLLGIFAVLGFIIPELQLSSGQVNIITFFGIIKLPNVSLSTLATAFLFGVFVIPIVEEMFFRAFIADLLLSSFPDTARGQLTAAAVAGGIFMAFHAAVYSLFFPSLNISLILILAGSGTAMVLVDLQTEDILTSIIGHSLNNALTFLAGGSIISYLFPGAHLPWQMIMLAPTVFLMLRVYRQGGLKIARR